MINNNINLDKMKIIKQRFVKIFNKINFVNLEQFVNLLMENMN